MDYMDNDYQHDSVEMEDLNVGSGTEVRIKAFLAQLNGQHRQ